MRILFRRSPWLISCLLLGLLTSCGGSASLPPAVPTAVATSVPATTAPITEPASPTLAPATMQPAPTPSPAPSATLAPEPSPTAAPAGVIFFVTPDGKTIKTIRPDGSDEQTLFTLPAETTNEISGLSGDPNGRFLLYGLDGFYSLIELGTSKPITYFVSLPRWSPDGTRFVAQEFVPPETPHHLYVYDTATGKGESLGLAGTAPDWFPDGQQLVFVDQGNIYTYDLVNRTATQRTNLPTDPATAWAVQEAHVTRIQGPDGKPADYIYFFGGEGSTLGASGNGQRWWSLPASGGTPEALTDPGGNFVLDATFSPDQSWLSYIDSSHSSACISIQQLKLFANGLGGIALTVPLAEVNEATEQYADLRGFSWSADNQQLAVSVQPYTCTATERVSEPPMIFIWNIKSGSDPVNPTTPRLLVSGLYPVWTK